MVGDIAYVSGDVPYMVGDVAWIVGDMAYTWKVDRCMVRMTWTNQRCYTTPSDWPSWHEGITFV